MLLPRHTRRVEATPIILDELVNERDIYCDAELEGIREPVPLIDLKRKARAIFERRAKTPNSFRRF